MAGHSHIRGAILKIVHGAGPGGCSDQYIDGVLNRLGETAARQQLGEHLQYLADKGLIVREFLKDDFADVKRWVNRALPLGVDVCVGEAEIAGVHVVY